MVSGRHTKNGLPLIANDPHLDLTVPAIFYPNHLSAEAAGFDVSGESFAGVPYVVLGQNRNIVWGATTNFMDVTDTFQEKVVPDPESPSGLSIVHAGNPEPILPIPQVFRYNRIGDGIDDNLQTAIPETVTAGVLIPSAVLIVPRRNYGPIVALDVAAGVALSIQYTGFSATREIDAFRDINLSRDLEDFVRSLQHFDVGSQNFAFADKHGNIGYFATAELPLREDLQATTVEGLPPFFIRNGEQGNEWLPVRNRQPGQAIDYEILPAREMPRLVNPPDGFFVNANNDPIGTTLDNNPLNQLRPGGGILYLNYTYDFGARAGLITRRLNDMIANGRVGTEDMKELQASVEMLDAHVFTPFIVQAHQNVAALAVLGTAGTDPRVGEAVGRLALWDFTAPTGVLEGYDGSDVDGSPQTPTAAEIDASVAATIYAVWRARMIANTVDTQLQARGLEIPDDQPAMTALRHLFDSFDANHGTGVSGIDFFPVPGIADPATRRDVVVLKSLIEALDLLKGPAFGAAFGGSADLGDYRWGRLHRLILAHPLGGPFDIPPAGGAFPPSFADLPGIAVDGGYAVIDRSDHNVRTQNGDAFLFVAGPVRRYIGAVGRVGEDIKGESSLPGGVSGVLGSPYHANLLAPWLTNDTYKVLRSETAIAANSIEEVNFTP